MLRGRRFFKVRMREQTSDAPDPPFAAHFSGMPGYSEKPLADKLGYSSGMVHLFATERAELARLLKALRPKIAQDAAVWVSWPKKSSGVATDITEDTIREVALPMGYVDIKVCAVTDVWSGLKLVIRKSERRA
jgi:hypothetical protein